MPVRIPSLLFVRASGLCISVVWLGIILFGWLKRPDVLYQLFGDFWMPWASLLVSASAIPVILAIGLVKPRSVVWWWYASGLAFLVLGLGGIFVGREVFPGGLTLMFWAPCLIGIVVLFLTTAVWLFAVTIVWLDATLGGSRQSDQS